MPLPMTPLRFLDRTAQLYRDKAAVVCGDATFTYAEFQARVNQLSHALQRRGVERGDRVAYLALNCHRMVEGYYGVPQIGAILLCLNIRLPPDEIAFILNDAAPRVLLLSPTLVSLWDAIKDRCPSVEHIVLMEGRLHNDELACYDEVIAAEPTTGVPAVIDENDTAELFYTSGTTAMPKGVMLTYRNLYAHALSVALSLGLNDSLVTVVGTVPLFHVNSWGSPHYTVAVGGTQVVVPKFDPETLCQAIQTNRATNLLLVPSMLNTLLAFPDLSLYDLSSLRTVILGGAPTPYALVEAGRKVLDCECMVGYGLTETSPVVSIATLKSTLADGSAEDKARRQAMTGIPLIGVDVEIFDAGGQVLEHDGIAAGELAVRGDTVMKGYWNRPEETAAVFHDDGSGPTGRWFLTGDIATIDAEGYINIVDRKKDMIISGGENISAVEIEDVLYRHDAVLDAAVIGIFDEQWGEVPHAIVVLRPAMHATGDELIAFSRSRLASFKVPHSVAFATELPKTGTGKVLKKELRARYRDGADSGGATTK